MAVKTKKLKPKELQYYLDKCDKHIHAIYRFKVQQRQGKKMVTLAIEWRVTSDTIGGYNHFDKDGNHRFSKSTLLESMVAFYTFLKKKKKI